MTAQLVPLVARAAGVGCVGYYRNEAAAGKEVRFPTNMLTLLNVVAEERCPLLITALSYMLVA